jgi:hypothetical protein
MPIARGRQGVRASEQFRAAKKPSGTTTSTGTAAGIRALPFTSNDGAGNRREFTMPLRGYSGYSDVNWFVRALRIVPVIAGAALVGGMIGGFAMFAIDSALNWEPAQRLDVRADDQANAQASTQANTTEQRATRPVRIVGGAIPDPSAGMSAPVPAPPQQHAPAPAQPQIPSQLLTPKPLGPATQLQPQAVTTTSAAQTSNQPPNQATNQPQNQTANQRQNAAAAAPARWPDALSHAHQNAPNAQQQNVPPPAAAQTGVANTSSETDSKAADRKRAVNGDDQDRAAYSRHSRRRTTFGANDFSTAPSSRRQNAQSYDRLYDYYGNRRDRSSGYRREQPYGDGFDAGRQGEPYWGGGFYRRGGGGYQPGDY